MEENMKEFVEYIAQSLVDNPAQVTAQEIQEGNSILIKLQVAPDEMGRVIGKQGRTINAMRTLLRVMAAKQHTRVTLELAQASD
jgi:predicted RNA-binding protein YlqC (UPF0109 family)